MAICSSVTLASEGDKKAGAHKIVSLLNHSTIGKNVKYQAYCLMRCVILWGILSYGKSCVMGHVILLGILSFGAYRLGGILSWGISTWGIVSWGMSSDNCKSEQTRLTWQNHTQQTKPGKLDLANPAQQTRNSQTQQIIIPSKPKSVKLIH